MKSRRNVLNTVRFVGGTVLITGVAIFLFGLLVSAYSFVIPFGIGTSIGAVFIFITGLFFVASEEMVANSYR